MRLYSIFNARSFMDIPPKLLSHSVNSEWILMIKLLTNKLIEKLNGKCDVTIYNNVVLPQLDGVKNYNSCGSDILSVHI